MILTIPCTCSQDHVTELQQAPQVATTPADVATSEASTLETGVDDGLVQEHQSSLATAHIRLQLVESQARALNQRWCSKVIPCARR